MQLTKTFLILTLVVNSLVAFSQQKMNEMWGEQVVTHSAQDANHGQLFSDGNYAMFIHW